jgi:hypothetical protein
VLLVNIIEANVQDVEAQTDKNLLCYVLFSWQVISEFVLQKKNQRDLSQPHHLQQDATDHSCKNF